MRAQPRATPRDTRERPIPSVPRPEGAQEPSPGQRPGTAGATTLPFPRPEGAQEPSPGQRPGTRGTPTPLLLALKGRKRPAQGNALGHGGTPRSPALKGQETPLRSTFSDASAPRPPCRGSGRA